MSKKKKTQVEPDYRARCTCACTQTNKHACLTKAVICLVFLQLTPQISSS